MRTWDLVFLVGLAVYVVIRGVFIEKTRANVKASRRVDLQEGVLLFSVFTTTLLLPLLYLFTSLLTFADYTLPLPAPWCGVVVMPFALWLFFRSHADLGQNWSQTLEIRAGHVLVTQGVYRSTRHPMYSAILLFSLAQGLLLANWLAGWSGLVAVGAMFVLRIPREEQMMRDTFGLDYRRYMARTGRLFPPWTKPAPSEPRH